MNSNKLTTLLFPLTFWFLAAHSIVAQEDASITPLTIGQTISFKSELLGEERRLNVYLPLNYAKEKQATFPVIYVLDGSLDEDFIHIAGLTQFGSFPWIKMLPESIVVGIANVDRKRDFTSTSTNEDDQLNFPTSGESAKFIKSLEQEILPMIKKRYRTNGVDSIIGQSLGGLLATEVLFTRPRLFDNYIIVSPSLWWNDQQLLKSDLPNFDQPKSVFVGVGNEGQEMQGYAKQLFEKLEAAKDDRLRHFYQYFPEQDHGDTLHLAVYRAFESIFLIKTEK
ncbi:MAG: alpha/beta hydrolase-fold protein [Planctomycetota bacterium]